MSKTPTIGFFPSLFICISTYKAAINWKQYYGVEAITKHFFDKGISLQAEEISLLVEGKELHLDFFFNGRSK